VVALARPELLLEINASQSFLKKIETIPQSILDPDRWPINI